MRDVAYRRIKDQLDIRKTKSQEQEEESKEQRATSSEGLGTF